MKNDVCVISVLLGLAVLLFFCCEPASAATVEPNFIAMNPNPADGQTHVGVEPNLTLSWDIGDVNRTDYGVGYDLFFGTDRNEVETSTEYFGRTVVENYTVSGLEHETEYFWRIDMVVLYWDTDTYGFPLAIIRLIKGDVWGFTTAPGPPRVITVDDDGPANFNNIQAAIDDSNDGDTVEIQPGRYVGPGNHDIDFKGKAITVTSSDPADPNIVAATIIDCNDMSRGFYFHSQEGANSVLAGLTIANGYPGSRANGGGIYCFQSSPLITNCTFRDNRFELGGCGGGNGGGMYNLESNPTLIDCAFMGNSAYYSGGGMYNSQSSLTLINCTFVGNLAYDGGGMYNSLSSATLINCTFSANEAAAEGGGLCDKSGTTRVSGCVFSANSADMGGAVYSISEGDMQLVNSIFAGNTATDTGGGLWLISASGEPSLTNCVLMGNRSLGNEGSQILYGGCSTLKVTSCIFWNHSSPESIAISLYSGRCYSMITTISHSDIQGSLSSVYVDENGHLNWGPGSIDADPCFADAGYWDPNGTPEDANDDFWVDGDYHLKSQAGRYDPNEGRWAKDEVTSPCIDSGDSISPIGPEPFPNGGIINMGAYGGTGEASKSYFGKPPCETVMAGDVNGDCEINFEDLRLMGLHWCEDNNP